MRGISTEASNGDGSEAGGTGEIEGEKVEWQVKSGDGFQNINVKCQTITH